MKYIVWIISVSHFQNLRIVFIDLLNKITLKVKFKATFVKRDLCYRDIDGDCLPFVEISQMVT